MPKTKRMPVFQIRLSADDNARFETYCLAQKKSKTEVGREAVLYYLDNVDKLRSEARDLALTVAIKKMSDRIANITAAQAWRLHVVFEIFHETYLDQGKEAEFVELTNRVRDQVIKRMADDEKRIAEKMKGYFLTDADPLSKLLLRLVHDSEG